jgi:hypothetical protein
MKVGSLLAGPLRNSRALDPHPAAGAATFSRGEKGKPACYLRMARDLGARLTM